MNLLPQGFADLKTRHAALEDQQLILMTAVVGWIPTPKSNENSLLVGFLQRHNMSISKVDCLCQGGWLQRSRVPVCAVTRFTEKSNFENACLLVG